MAASHDPHEYTRAAHAAGPGTVDYWERKVDPHGQLEPKERARRARAAMRLHFSRLSLLAVKARKRQNGGNRKQR